MKVRNARKPPQKNIPVQIRIPPELHRDLTKSRPEGWSLQRLIVAALKQINADENFVLEVQR